MQLLHTKMYPQSELDNYKLQVDLLQDKLKRSEENRQQLEQELKQILHKRNEHDKALRSKSRQKYQQFLDEQQKRNERNKMLVQMLERIDQQTATLSARSERLKMMKIQYERYIAKLMQTQAMHCIQNTPTTAMHTAAIPILLPTAAATTPAAVTSTPIRNNDNAAAYQFDANLMATGATTGNITIAQQPPPAAQTIVTSTTDATAAPQLTPRIWTLAMATPTPAGLLLTSAPTATTSSAQPPAAVAAQAIQQEYFANYLQYPTPFGYMPLIQQQQLQQQLQQTLLQASPRMAATTAFPSELLQTNRSNYNNNNDTFDRMNDAILGDAKKLATTIDFPASKYDSNNFAKTAAAGKRIEPMMSPTDIPLRKDGYNYDGDNNTDQQHLLSTAAVPYSSSSALTFDKLPVNLTDATAVADDKNNDIVFAAAVAAKKPQVSFNIDDFVGSNSNYENGALPNSRVEYEKSQSFTTPRAVTAVNDNRYDDSEDDIAAASSALAAVALEKSKAVDGGSDTTNSRQKFDDVTWQQRRQQLPPPPASEHHKQETTMQSNAASESGRKINADDNSSGNLRDIIEKRGEAQNRNASLSSGGFSEVSQASSVAAAPSPLMNDKTGNQFSQSQMESSSSILAPAASAAATVLNPISAQMSIENIENAIYGELVNPPMTVDKPVAQGFFEDLVTTQPQEVSMAGAKEKESITERNPAAAAAAAFEQQQQLQNEVKADYTNYTTPTYADEAEDITLSSAITSGSGGGGDASGTYDPTYATIEGTTNAEVYSTQAMNDPNVTAYEQQEANATDYAQYDVLANNSQQDYTNLDYANYDATQYDAGAYDPNAYPGYTYDETTGQYTPTDPNAQQQQYATDEAYAAAYEQQQQQQQQPERQYDPSQQDANYDYSAYEQQQQQQQQQLAENVTATAEMATTEVAATFDEVTAPPAASSITTTVADVDAAASSKVNLLKQPTSILSTSSTTAVAAVNEAHKKKKRVNFVDSSETDDSSSMKVAAGGGAGATVNTGAADAGGGASSESDFDFSNSGSGGGDGGVASGGGK